jgi:hypothetical protein
MRGSAEEAPRIAPDVWRQQQRIGVAHAPVSLEGGTFGAGSAFVRWVAVGNLLRSLAPDRASNPTGATGF